MILFGTIKFDFISGSGSVPDNFVRFGFSFSFLEPGSEPCYRPLGETEDCILNLEIKSCEDDVKLRSQLLLKCILLDSAGNELPVSFHFILCSCSRMSGGLTVGSMSHSLNFVTFHRKDNFKGAPPHYTTKGFSGSRKADENVKLLQKNHSWLANKAKLEFLNAY